MTIEPQGDSSAERPLVTEASQYEAYCWQLQRALSNSGLSRLEVAGRLGVSAATIKSWVVGRRCPTVSRLIDLCAVLGTDVGRLFEQPTDAPTPLTCGVCERVFRHPVGYRIHLALKAKECILHANLAHAHRGDLVAQLAST